MAPTTRSAAHKAANRYDPILSPRSATEKAWKKGGQSLNAEEPKPSVKKARRKPRHEPPKKQQEPAALALPPGMTVSAALAKGRTIVAGWNSVKRAQPFVHAYKEAINVEPLVRRRASAKRSRDSDDSPGPFDLEALESDSDHEVMLQRRAYAERAWACKPRRGIVKAILHACYVDPDDSPINPEVIDSDSDSEAEMALRMVRMLGKMQYKDLSPDDLTWYLKQARRVDPRLPGATRDRLAIRGLLALLMPAPPAETLGPDPVVPRNSAQRVGSGTISGLQRLPLEVCGMILGCLPSISDVYSATRAASAFRYAFPQKAGPIVPRLLCDTFWVSALISDPKELPKFTLSAEALSVTVDPHERDVIARNREVDYSIAKLRRMADAFPLVFGATSKQRQGLRTPRARVMLALAALIIDYVDAAVRIRLESIIAFQRSVPEELGILMPEFNRRKDQAAKRAEPWRRVQFHPGMHHGHESPETYLPFSDFHCLEEQFEYARQGWEGLQKDLRSADDRIIAAEKQRAAWTEADLIRYHVSHGPQNEPPSLELYNKIGRARNSREITDLVTHSGRHVFMGIEANGLESFTRQMLNVQSGAPKQGPEDQMCDVRNSVRVHALTELGKTYTWAAENVSERDRLILRLDQQPTSNVYSNAVQWKLTHLDRLTNQRIPWLSRERWTGTNAMLKKYLERE